METSNEDFLLNETEILLKHLENESWEEKRYENERMDYKTVPSENKVLSKRKMIGEECRKTEKREIKIRANREITRKVLNKNWKEKKNNVDKVKEKLAEDEESVMDDDNDKIESNAGHKLKKFEKEINESNIEGKSEDTNESGEKLPNDSTNINDPIIQKLFEEIGKESTDFFIRNVVGDEGCGFSCIALHCNQLESDFRKVRRDISKFIIHHLEFLVLESFYGKFTDGIQFNVGMNKRTFHSRIEFLCFLDSEDADLL